jgi:peptidoglycan/xylan/chitin deacetylase (PgdA/CDA1 family)
VSATTSQNKANGRQDGGCLVISLDFELYWGMRDKVPLDQYRSNLAGVQTVTPRLLQLFRKYDVHATWATVGFLFFDTKRDLLGNLPARQPRYTDARLSPYARLAEVGADEQSDPYHFAASLVRQIVAASNQELATHTFSHYYCLEPGQTGDDFRDDIATAQRVAREKFGRELVSLVFPRNQANKDYLRLCHDLGILAYRGTETSWFYAPRPERANSLLRRAFRLLDTYINLSGANTYRPNVRSGAPTCLPSSRFLRPYAPRLRALERFRERRIVSAMASAARRGEVFHLWWHPHNFGIHTDENCAFLERLLIAFSELSARYGMRSLTMSEVVREYGTQTDA